MAAATLGFLSPPVPRRALLYPATMPQTSILHRGLIKLQSGRLYLPEKRSQDGTVAPRSVFAVVPSFAVKAPACCQLIRDK
jgi:hypothetical protein